MTSRRSAQALRPLPVSIRRTTIRRTSGTSPSATATTAENASAVAAYYHPNEDTLINVGSTLGNGNNMVTAGVSFKFGPSGGTHTMSRTALTQQVSTLREQNQGWGRA